jgi:hypothetical protein
MLDQEEPQPEARIRIQPRISPGTPAVPLVRPFAADGITHPNATPPQRAHCRVEVGNPQRQSEHLLLPFANRLSNHRRQRCRRR